MVARKNTTPSLGIIDALDSLASEVRKNHPEVPDNIVIALASGKKNKGMIHGHFAPETWTNGHEILFSGESLQRGAGPTFGTLIHELAHATAHVTGVRDTSNHGRYHNKRFKEIAEKLGISVEQDGTIGWSVTTLPEETAKRYAKGLERLEKALTTYRKGFVASAPVKTPTTPVATKKKIVCDCEDEVTVSIQWFDRQEGHLHCNNCDTDYRDAK